MNDAVLKKGSFVAQIRGELKHVTWPTRQEAMRLTVTVFIISLIVALYVGIIDFFMAKLLEVLAGR